MKILGPVFSIATTTTLLLCSNVQADHLSGGFNLGQSSAILTESAIPLPQGSWFTAINTEIVENRDFSDDKLVGLRALDILEHGNAHSDLHSVESISSTSLALGYGITENFTASLVLPYIKRENIREPEEGHGHEDDPIVVHNVIEHGDSSGLGDATLMGMYRFRATELTNMAVLFGIKLPTGDTDETGFRDEVFVRRIDTGVVPDHHEHGDEHEGEEEGHHHEGNRLETHQQPGSGSYDPIIGLAYSQVLGIFNLDSSLIYTLVNEGSQHTDLGDSFKYNLSLAYPVTSVLNLVMEFNGEWRDEEDRDGETIENSGGSHLYASPGVRYRSPERGWSASLSYGIPISENINGFHSEPEDRWLGTLSFNF